MYIHFGFSYTGLTFLLMLMIPNFVWSKNKPKEYDKYVKNENKVLEKELIGYADYKKKVKYKVIPFIWRT